MNDSHTHKNADAAQHHFALNNNSFAIYKTRDPEDESNTVSHAVRAAAGVSSCYPVESSRFPIVMWPERPERSCRLPGSSLTAVGCATAPAQPQSAAAYSSSTGCFRDG